MFSYQYTQVLPVRLVDTTVVLSPGKTRALHVPAGLGLGHGMAALRRTLLLALASALHGGGRRGPVGIGEGVNAEAVKVDRIRELCPQTLTPGPGQGQFQELDFAALPASAEVHVCVDRSGNVPGLVAGGRHSGALFVKNFLTPNELQQLHILAETFDADGAHTCVSSAASTPTKILEARLERFLGVPHTRDKNSPKSVCFTTSPEEPNRKFPNDSGPQCAELPQALPDEQDETAEGSGAQTEGEEEVAYRWSKLPCRMYDKYTHLDVGKFSTPWVTALIYLTDVPTGGHTLFPALRTPSFPSHNRLKLEDAQGNDLIVEQSIQRFGHRWRSYAVASMCAQVAEADRLSIPYDHFGIPPQAGGALFFWHFSTYNATKPEAHVADAQEEAAVPIAVVDRTLHHTSCDVIAGNKTTIQSFREPPKSWYEKRGAEPYYRGANEFAVHVLPEFSLTWSQMERLQKLQGPQSTCAEEAGG